MYNNMELKRARKRPKYIPADNVCKGSSGVSKSICKNISLYQKFDKDVRPLVSVFEELGNPFL